MRFDKNFGLVIYRHLVRCYGYYSNRSRGARRLVEKGNEPAASIRMDPPPADHRRKANRARPGDGRSATTR